MKVSDSRNVDFDSYRRRACDLRQQAIDESIDRAIAWMKALLVSRPRPAVAAAARVASGSAQCSA